MPPRKRPIYRDGFFKVSRRLIGSTLWREPGDVLKVFLALLEEAQDPASPRDGTVYIAREILAAKCLMDDERLGKSLAILASPDPQSRTQHDDGRRIDVLPNGYRIINYGLYHDRSKDEITSAARRNAGKIGGKRSAQVRRNQADASKQIASPPRSKTKHTRLIQDGDKTETETTSTDAAATGGGVPFFDPEDPASVAAGYVGVFNAAFERRCTVTAGIGAKVKQRLAQRDASGKGPAWRAWQIVAQPLLVYANCTDEAFRSEINPEWCLRDGSRPRTTSTGRTNGGTDWIEREYNRADRTVLDERLAAIARDAGVLERLQSHGVQVRGVA